MHPDDYTSLGYNPADEWDRYLTRYGGYELDTLEEFERTGVASYDETRDVWTIQASDGTTFEVCDETAPRT
ncbi:hypothetical protein [Actinomadura sp. 6N118]|uniref:hypothetical protein n=1 Tax=Actinomadura sp. 6N118 TaxID=3375151 RepID=UPI0037AC7F1D